MPHWCTLNYDSQSSYQRETGPIFKISANSRFAQVCKDTGGKALNRYYNSSYNDIELCLRFESYAYIFTYQKTD